MRNYPSGASARTAVANDFDFSGGGRFSFAWSLLRRCARRPADCLGMLLAVAATITIVVNALYLQKGPHPAPIIKPNFQRISAFDTTGSLVAVPRPRPPELAANPVSKEPEASARPRIQLIADIQRELAQRGFYDAPIDGLYGPKMDAAIRDFEQAAGLKSSGEPTEPLLSAVIRSPAKAPDASCASRRDVGSPSSCADRRQRATCTRCRRAARAGGFWIWPAQAHRRVRREHKSGDREVRARA